MEVRNIFKGRDLINRGPDELWTEVHNIVQETGIKTIPKKKKCIKAKRLPEELWTEACDTVQETGIKTIPKKKKCKKAKWLSERPYK